MKEPMNQDFFRCGDTSVDRSTFADNIEHAAGGLAAAGIKPGDCIALLLGNSVAFVEISLAVGLIGAYAVPINWHFTAIETGQLLDDCTPKLIFVDRGREQSVPPRWSAGVPLIEVGSGSVVEQAPTINYCAWRAAAPRWLGEAQPNPGSIVYTSGTTGQPKGVKREAATPDQQAAMEQVRARLYRVACEDRVLVPGPLYHAFPNQLATHAARNAAFLEIMTKFDAEEMLQIIERERITSIGLAPIMFIRLLKLPEQIRKKYDVTSLRWAIHAGGPCPPDIKRQMIDWWGPVIGEYYGGTETGPLTLCTSEDWLTHPGTCGQRIPGVVMKIVDVTGREVATGEAGEIFGRLASYPDFTYHNDPEKRREVGLGDLVSLGDIGYFDDEGFLYLSDRARDMIVSGGVNIYPAEVEAALIAIPGVEDCAVFGIPDAEFGEATVAFVVGRDIDPAGLRQELRHQIAGYKVPKEIVTVTSINRDASGKVRKQRLREHHLAQMRVAAQLQ